MSTGVLFDIGGLLIAVILVVTDCILMINGKSLPDSLVAWTWAVMGAHFGVGGIKAIVQNTVGQLGVSTTTTTPDLGPAHPSTSITTKQGNITTP